VRFSESERYDINLDCEVVCFVATTSTGSYFSEIPVDSEQSKKRKQFKDKVIELMENGHEPGEISFS